MRKIKVGVSLGLGCEIEVEESATPDEIEERVREWARQHVDVDWWSDEE